MTDLETKMPAELRGMIESLIFRIGSTKAGGLGMGKQAIRQALIEIDYVYERTLPLVRM